VGWGGVSRDGEEMCRLEEWVGLAEKWVGSVNWKEGGDVACGFEEAGVVGTGAGSGGCGRKRRAGMCGGRRGGLVWSVCEVGGSHVLVFVGEQRLDWVYEAGEVVSWGEASQTDIGSTPTAQQQQFQPCKPFAAANERPVTQTSEALRKP